MRKAPYSLAKWVDLNKGRVLREMARQGETNMMKAARVYLTAWEPNLEKALLLWWLGERPPEPKRFSDGTYFFLEDSDYGVAP